MKRIVTILVFTCACYQLQAQVNTIATICGTDSMGYGGDGGPATSARLYFPVKLCLDNFGNLYIADAANNRIRKIILSTGIINTVAGIDTAGYNGDGIPATNASLSLTNGVCTDSIGNVYIADAFNSRIRKITIATGIITTIAGNGIAGNTGDGLEATNAQINAPQGITIDKLGNLYFVDGFSNNVRKINTSGIITTVAGNGISGYTGDGGNATNAELNEPEDVRIDNSGNVIISDYANHAIRKVNAVTGIITTIAGNGTPGYTGNGGLAINAKMNFPNGMFIDRENNIFIAEPGNEVVRRIDGSTNIISTVVGCGTIGFSGDGGPATAAELQPADIWIDTAGIMYIADFINNRIRIVYNPALSVSSANISNPILVYPNPAQDEITIENTAGSDVRVYNLLGQEVLSGKIISSKTELNVRQLMPGVYTLLITNPSMFINRNEKIVITK